MTATTDTAARPEPAGLVRLRALALARLAQAEAGNAPHGWGKYAADAWRRYLADLESPTPSHDGDCERPYRPMVCNCAKRARIRKYGDDWSEGELIFVSPECPRCGEETNPEDGGFDCERCHVRFGGSGTFSHFSDDMGDDLMDGVDRAAIEAMLLGGAR